MGLKQTIQENLKNALTQHDEVVLGVLRMLLAAIINKEKEKQFKISKESPNATKAEWQEKSQLSDAEIQDVVMSEAKKRRESIEAFTKGNRPELVDKETKELEVLKSYMPEQLSENEIRIIVKEAISKTGAASQKDIGKLMAVLMPQLKGKSDGTIVSKIVKEYLTL